VTEVTMSPGSAATGQPSGRIPKAQFKTFYDTTHDDGFIQSDLLHTRNVKAAEGTSLTRVTMNDVARGQRLRVQANVTGIDPNRTDVVTVDTHVKLRPDPAVIEVNGLSNAHVHVPVNIGALLRELNGDVGATANCVLYIDGVEVDRVQGLWIDAGSAIDCAFKHTFTEVGAHEVTILVENVAPGDFDHTNNAFVGEITIVGSGYRLRTSASYQEYQYEHHFRQHSTYHDADRRHEYIYEQGQEQRYVGLSMSASAPLIAPIGAGTQVTFTEALDGAPGVTGVDTISDARIQDSEYNTLNYMYDENGNVILDLDGNAIVHEFVYLRMRYVDISINGAIGGLYAQEYDSDFNGTLETVGTYVYLHRYTGDVLYYGREFESRADAAGNIYYEWQWGYENANTYGTGAFTSPAQSYDFQLDLTADRLYTTGPQRLLLDDAGLYEQREGPYDNSWAESYGDENIGGTNSWVQHYFFLNRYWTVQDLMFGE
jgi:hypothetical protein